MREKKPKAFVISFIFLTTAVTFIMFSLSAVPESLYRSNFGSNNCITAFPTVLSAPHESTNKATGLKGFDADLLLFGIFPIKKVGITVVPEKTLIPCGRTFGIKFFTEGVMVVGMSDVKTDSGSENPAFAAGIRVRDIILSINEQTVNSNEDVANIVENCNGKALKFLCKRNLSTFEVSVLPKNSSRDKAFKIGIWVRDSTAGIGTITYIDPKNGTFGGLGHGICDIDTGDLLPLSKASIYSSKINSVKKGLKGEPGELRGVFLEDTIIGKLTMNSDQGIFGSISLTDFGAEPLLLAYKQDIKEGGAKILCTIDGMTPEYYNISIIRVNRSSGNTTKNMVIRITDEKLLEKTGGIVQGMSGSPIIQDNKLVGAVTHVFVNDPTRGYGIFIENMLEGCGEYKKAA